MGDLRVRDLEVNSKIKNRKAKLWYPKGMIFYDDFWMMAISAGVRARRHLANHLWGNVSRWQRHLSQKTAEIF
jgi:hypothetical protein